MANILKEMLKFLPAQKISASAFEGANIVLYTKDKEFLTSSSGLIRQVVDEFKKRVELRPDPTISMDPEQAEEHIRKIIDKDANVGQIFFEPQRSVVNIEVEKPGGAIGRNGEILKQIKEETCWVPIIKRNPPLRSKLIDNIRAVLYQNSDYRRKFLHKTGQRIYDGWIRGKKEEWVRISFLGSGRQVGRSALLLQTPESRVLLDCGVDVTKTGQDSFPILDAPEFNIQELDAVILSHAHTDHCGFLPFLYKYGYRGPIYCTEPTRDVSALLLLDYLKIQKQENMDSVFEVDDIKEMVKHVIPLNYEEVTDITPDVRITFYNSGHVLGAAVTHIHIGNGLHNLLYTGDIKFGKTHLLDPTHTKFPRVESMILESTYGGAENLLEDVDQEDQHILETINAVIERGGKALLPTLGSGRAQEIMIMLAKYMDQGKIPKVPVYIDGMIKDVNAIYTAYPEFTNKKVREEIFRRDNNPFLHEMFKEVGSHKERMKIVEEEGSCIIIATSGMLNGGPSVEYLKQLCGDKRHLLAFTSYQGEGSLGRRIRNGDRQFMIKEGRKENRYEIKMEISKLEISGHSDRRELMNFVQRCNPRPRKILINHGEPSRALDLASSLHKKFRVETITPRNLESYRLR